MTVCFRAFAESAEDPPESEKMAPYARVLAIHE